MYVVIKHKHSIHLFYITLLIILSSYGCQSTNYCSLSPHHVLCNYKDTPGPSCHSSGAPIMRKLTEVQKQLMLKLHNEARSKVAVGSEPRGNPGPQPSAANMLQMIWDDELERIAQAVADTCVFEHSCQHCRHTEAHSTGENLYSSTMMGWDPDVMYEVNQTVKGFYEEVQYYDSSRVGHFKGINLSKIGHYTQLMWADSFKLGCGYTTRLHGRMWKTLVVCHYGPVGNILGKSLYKTGQPCSQCQTNVTSCSKDFQGLCQINDIQSFIKQINVPRTMPQGSRPWARQGPSSSNDQSGPNIFPVNEMHMPRLDKPSESMKEGVLKHYIETRRQKISLSNRVIFLERKLDLIRQQLKQLGVTITST